MRLYDCWLMKLDEEGCFQIEVLKCKPYEYEISPFVIFHYYENQKFKLSAPVLYASGCLL